MAWKKTSSILNARINHHGLGSAVTAGQLCIHAEALYPGLFTAVSFKNGVLHLRLSKQNQLQFTLIRGKLQDDLNTFATDKGLPLVTRIRLTFATD